MGIRSMAKGDHFNGSSVRSFTENSNFRRSNTIPNFTYKYPTRCAIHTRFPVVMGERERNAVERESSKPKLSRPILTNSKGDKTAPVSLLDLLFSHSFRIKLFWVPVDHRIIVVTDDWDNHLHSILNDMATVAHLVVHLRPSLDPRCRRVFP